MAVCAFSGPAHLRSGTTLSALTLLCNSLCHAARRGLRGAARPHGGVRHDGVVPRAHGAARLGRAHRRRRVDERARAAQGRQEKKNRRRPKKRRPSDINRKAPEYDVVPGLADKPKEWSLVSEPPANFDADAYLAQIKAEVEAQAGHSYCTPLNPREPAMPSETPADVYHPLTVPQSV